MVNVWKDAFAPTSLGTGVAKTTLNGGNAYNVSQKAGALIEISPESITTGAFTAAESFMLRVIAESTDLPTITPKEFVGSFGLGGLGTFGVAGYPALRAYPVNTRLNKTTAAITFSGQAQVANTVAPEMLLDLTFTDGPPIGPEQYYIAPANETSTGTASAEVAGNQITINGGSLINKLYGILTPGTVTASESYSGRGSMASNNFIGVPSPQKFSTQPIAVALGTAIGVVGFGDRWWDVSLPIGNSFLADTSLFLDEALTAAGNFIIGCGFLKPAQVAAAGPR